MTKWVTLNMVSETPCITLIKGALRSSGNNDKAQPNRIAKNSTDSSLPCDMARTMLSGTIASSTWPRFCGVPLEASPVAGACSVLPNSAPEPGCTTLPTNSPKTMAMLVMVKKYTKVFRPTRPRADGLPMPAMPTVMQANTRGTTIIFISLINRSPAGCSRLSMNQVFCSGN